MISFELKLLTLVLALAPTAAAAAEASGQLELLVVDGDRGRPIAGLTVWIDGARRGVTDGDGALTVDLAAGEHTVGLRGDGWAPRVLESVPITADRPTELIVRLTRASAMPTALLEQPSGARARTTSTATRAAERAAITGVVTRADDGRPLAGATVLVRGGQADATTDAAGRFRLRVPAGPCDLAVVHPDMTTLERPGLVAPATVALALTPASAELEALVVLTPKIVGGAASLQEERAQASAIADFVGAEAMSKQGDSDAAGALSRVTGLTVVGGRFVYVRGLGERYSSTLLDGSSLPSPEPEGRVVPLDMFPASILHSVVVEKTYAVERPGEFGGGTVILRTREPPKVLEGKLSLAVSGVLGTTFADGMAAAGGPLDVLGFGAARRALPDEVAAAAEESQLREGDLFSARGFTPAELERLGEQLPSDPALHRSAVMPNLSLSGTWGGPLGALGPRGGWIAGAVYRHESDCCARDSATYVGADTELKDRYTFDERSDEVTLSAVLGAQVDLGDAGLLRYTGLVDRISTGAVSVGTGRIRDGNVDETVYDVSWRERMLVTQQLRAEHPLAAGWALSWRYMFSLATLDDPDHRSLRYELEPTAGVLRLSRFPDNNLRVFTALVDLGHDASAELSWDLGSTPDAPRRVVAGVGAAIKSRDVRARRYKFAGSPPDDVLALGPGDIFNPSTIGPGAFQLFELSRASDMYTGDQLTVAAFAAGEWSWGRALRATGGVRVEHARIGISTYDPFQPDLVPLSNSLDGTDVLPSLGVAWEVAPDMFVRAGLARSVSRPNFRERSPARVKEQLGQPEVGGNPELEAATLTHLDARWEWFFGRGEALSVSAFGKLFDSPIERTIVPSADTVVTFTNADGAVSAGVELEGRATLGFVSGALRDVFVAANATWVWSRVDLGDAGGTQTSRTRPLQGQSPYVFNVQLGYDGVDSGTSVLALFQVFGPRISDIGSNGLPDYYEQPQPTLDVVFTQALPGGWELTARAKNLIDPVREVTVGDQVAQRSDRGRQLTLGLSWKL